jgi:hypothetical protein
MEWYIVVGTAQAAPARGLRLRPRRLNETQASVLSLASKPGLNVQASLSTTNTTDTGQRGTGEFELRAKASARYMQNLQRCHPGRLSTRNRCIVKDLMFNRMTVRYSHTLKQRRQVAHPLSCAPQIVISWGAGSDRRRMVLPDDRAMRPVGKGRKSQISEGDIVARSAGSRPQRAYNSSEF